MMMTYNITYYNRHTQMCGGDVVRAVHSAAAVQQAHRAMRSGQWTSWYVRREGAANNCNEGGV